MKFSEQWLREWINPDLSTEALAEQLTMAGLEVDAVEPAAGEFSGVVVGEVLSVTPHPQADKLNLTRVSVGEGEPLDIVCGAKNVSPGIKVPTAVIGAVLPGNFKIKKAKLRGEPSHGMLCSAKELGLAESADGLMILPADAPVGRDIRDYLELEDWIIDVDFTPNRGDCLSIGGMAREVAVLNGMDFTPPAVETVVPTCDDRFAIELAAPADCARYLGRVIRGVNARAETPLWLQERLRRCGLRSLGPVVDVTNFILMELGQPMHAFDLAKLSGKIVVRRAHEGEKIKLLDESEVELQGDCLVIADDKAIQAFAGVMGGAESAVGDDTCDLFLEVAFFNPDTIRGRARRFGMQTDSSYRFERGVDFNLQQRAMERATALILEICGGQAGPVEEAVSAADLPARQAITLRHQRIARLLGLSLERAEVGAILRRLGMTLEETAEGWQVTPPSYRFDIAIEADLIEEIGRIHGYNNLPTRLPEGQMRMGGRSESALTLPRLRQALVDRGYQEAITYSFVDENILAKLTPGLTPKALHNPISAEMSHMRTTLWAGLIKTLAHNQARQQGRLRLFEIGQRFIPQGESLRQETTIAGLISGPRLPQQWDGKPLDVDFYDLKADLEVILGLTGCAGDFIFKAEKHPALHPGQSASIQRGDRSIGWIGTLNPALGRELGLLGEVYLFELNYADLKQGGLPAFQAVSKYPSIRRDLALVVEEGVSARAVCDAMYASGRDLLKELEIFDVYRGNGIPKGKKSLAIALSLQDDNQTLTDDGVEKLLQAMLAALEKSVGATLRE